MSIAKSEIKVNNTTYDLNKYKVLVRERPFELDEDDQIDLDSDMLKFHGRLMEIHTDLMKRQYSMHSDILRISHLLELYLIREGHSDLLEKHEKK